MTMQPLALLESANFQDFSFVEPSTHFFLRREYIHIIPGKSHEISVFNSFVITPIWQDQIRPSVAMSAFQQVVSLRQSLR